MAYIKVDHSKFEDAADAIESYVSFMKKKMKEADKEVASISSGWQGADYAAFKSQWDKVNDKDSTYMHMVTALESYAKYLRYAAQKYKDTQSKAVNRANGLPK